MRKIRVVSVFVLVALMVTSIVACSPSTEVVEETEAAEVETEESVSPEVTEESEPVETEEEEAKLPGEGMKFVSITNMSTNLSAISMNEGAKEVLEAAGAEFTALYYEDNLNTMVSMIENAVASGYDGMILQNNLNFEAGVDAILEGLDNGMVIMEYDGDYKEIEGIQYWFGGNNYEIGYAIGKMAGEWANEVLVANGIDVIAGSFDYRGIPDFVDRSDGIIAGLTETCPEAQVVREENASSTMDAMAKAENWLQAYPDMNLIVGIADVLVAGGAEALAAAGKDPEVTGAFSTDAIDVALEGIATGGIYKGTIDLGLHQVGLTGAQFMLDYLNGVEVEGREKYNYFPLTPVTADNIDEYWPKD